MKFKTTSSLQETFDNARTHTFTQILVCTHLCRYASLRKCGMLQLFVHACVQTHTHAYIHTRLHTYMHICIPVYVRKYLQYIETCMRAVPSLLYTEIHTYVHKCMRTKKIPHILQNHKLTQIFVRKAFLQENSAPFACLRKPALRRDSGLPSRKGWAPSTRASWTNKPRLPALAASCRKAGRWCWVTKC